MSNITNMVNNQTKKRALTVVEVAEYACVSRGTVENWLVNGLLPYEELPGRGSGQQKFKRIRLNDLIEFLDSHYKAPKPVRKTITSKELKLLPKENRYKKSISKL